VRETVLPLRAPSRASTAGDRARGGPHHGADRAAEADVFAELEQLAAKGERFSVLSEEAGLRSFGADYPLVLVDPVDGSLNAKQGIPFFAVMPRWSDGPASWTRWPAA